MSEPRRIDVERKTPLVITGIFLEILKGYFRQEQNQNLKYSDDKLESSLIIEPSHLWNPDNAQNRPGVYVRRDAMTPKLQKLGMDDITSIKDNVTKYSIYSRGEATLFSISKNVGEVEILASKVFDVMMAFSPIIRKDFGFTRFDVSTIFPVGQVEESEEFWTVPVGIMYEFTETWTLVQDAFPIKDILLKFNIAPDC